MEVIAFINEKGGVGKTTSTLHVGAALARRGKRVIVIDLDPQGTATAATLGQGVYPGVAELLDTEKPGSLTALAQHVPDWGFSLVPSSRKNLIARDKAISVEFHIAQFALINALAAEEDSADFVLIDAPANYGSLTAVAFVAANGIVAPIEPAGESTVGLALIQRRIAETRQLNKALELLGVVIVGFQSRHKIDDEVATYVAEGGFGWVERIRQTDGFKRAFFAQKPLSMIARTNTERAAVEEVDAIAMRLEHLVVSA